MSKEKDQTLERLLDSYARPGELYERLDGAAVRCYACAHRCRIPEGRRGVCQVRFNHEGTLMVPNGYVAGLQVDPTEKKPFFHVLPGSLALTFGMLGCSFHCPFCQNWVSSQALRDTAAGTAPESIDAQTMVALGLRRGAKLVASSYNEPLITTEWAVEVFKEAKAKGLLTLYVSNGYASEEVLEYLRPWLDGINIDLKCFSDRGYRWLGGVFQRVLDAIERAHGMGFWVEVVTLVVPGFNDSNEELRETARFLASVSSDIPWHVTAFHPDYKVRDGQYTPAATLSRAANIGHEEGLRFVYAGNLPGAVQSLENTYCPNCGKTLVERQGYRVSGYRITPEGRCPDCGTSIPGIW